MRRLPAQARRAARAAPGVVVPGLDVGRVLGVAPRAPRADRDDRGEPRADEVAEQLELERLERQRDAKPSSAILATRNASSVGRPRRSDASATARSAASAVWQQSPKSRIPVTRPRSSTRRLSRLKSPCTTWPRRCVPLRQHALLVAVEHARTSARLAGSAISSSSGRSRGASRTFQSSSRPAAGGRTNAAPGRAGRGRLRLRALRRRRARAPPCARAVARTAAPGGRRTSLVDASGRATGRSGSTAAMWAIAASSRSSAAGSSPGFEILSTLRLSSRNAWSRSLPSADAVPWTPNRSAAIRAASSAVNCGGVESRTELTAERSYAAALLPRPSHVGTIPGVQESLVRAKKLPLLREDRAPMSPTFRRLIDGYCGAFCGNQDGRSRR